VLRDAWQIDKMSMVAHLAQRVEVTTSSKQSGAQGPTKPVR
jgi:hypothetical protein